MSESGKNSSASSGNNSSSSSSPSSAEDAPLPELSHKEMMDELLALRAEMAEMKARDAAAAAAAALKEAVSTTKAPAPKASASQALVPFTPATGGDGRSSSPPKATISRRSWNSYEAGRRLARRMSQAAVVAVHAVLESGGTPEAAAEAGRAAARRAATPPGRKRK